MNMLRAQRDQLFEYGPFTIRRQRPGEGFGPLAIVDQMTLKTGAQVPMHRHQNDEIFTYVWRGSAQHQHENGERTSLNAKRVMVVNAGDGLRHEESAPLIESEMLQAYIRPATAGGDGRVQVYTRPEGAAVNSWTLLAGPEASEAPLTLRQAVYVYDLKLERDQTLQVPQRDGYAVWVSLLDGVVRVGDQRLHKGDAVSDAASLPDMRGERDATLICFLVQVDAPAVNNGTVSGQ